MSLAPESICQRVRLHAVLMLMHGALCYADVLLSVDSF